MNFAKPTGVKQPFQAVLFDLGVVMLHLRYERAIERALPLCDPSRMAGSQSFLSLLGRTHIVDDYERGDMTAHAFYSRFVEASGFTGSFETFVEIWRSIFVENDPMLDFAAAVARRWPVYFLTNASDLHVPWVFEKFPRLRVHQGYACSCYLRAIKPSREFYARALAHLGLRAGDCLFIDDRPENVAGARSCGIESVLYTEAPDTINRVSAALEFT